jgi:hypothetical protein
MRFRIPGYCTRLDATVTTFVLKEGEVSPSRVGSVGMG